MTQEVPVSISEGQVEDLSVDRVKGIGATVLTIGAATFANYGISFVLDYADRRVDDPAVVVPLLGSLMLMVVGKRMMDFADRRRMPANAESEEAMGHDPHELKAHSSYDITVFNDGSVMDLRPADRNPDPQDPRNR